MANMVPRLLGRRPAVRRKPLNHGPAHLPGHSPVGSVLAHAWRRRRAFGRRTSRREDLQRKSDGGYSNHSDSVGIIAYSGQFLGLKFWRNWRKLMKSEHCLRES